MQKKALTYLGIGAVVAVLVVVLLAIRGGLTLKGQVAPGGGPPNPQQTMCVNRVFPLLTLCQGIGVKKVEGEAKAEAVRQAKKTVAVAKQSCSEKKVVPPACVPPAGCLQKGAMTYEVTFDPPDPMIVSSEQKTDFRMDLNNNGKIDPHEIFSGTWWVATAETTATCVGTRFCKSGGNPPMPPTTCVGLQCAGNGSCDEAVGPENQCTCSSNDPKKPGTCVLCAKASESCGGNSGLTQMSCCGGFTCKDSKCVPQAASPSSPGF